MSAHHTFSRAQLRAAVSSSHSWRGVLRALGRPGGSAGTLRSVRRHVDALGIDYSHFTGQRRWSNGQLTDAVAQSHTWVEVLERLGLTDGGNNLRAARTHAKRLGIDLTHLQRQPHPAVPDQPIPEVKHLRVAGTALAAAWFMLRGYEVLWPLEPCRYDLAVRAGGAFQRVQVKTATYRSDGAYVARLCNSRRDGQLVYDVDEIDCFFVIDADLNAYQFPYADVAGIQQVSLRAYAAYLVAERGQWLTPPVRPSASARAAPAP